MFLCRLLNKPNTTRLKPCCGVCENNKTATKIIYEIQMYHKKFTTSVTLLCLALTSCSEMSNIDTQQVSHSTVEQHAPASKFDLSHWYLTVPLDKNNDGVSDIYDVAELETYSHPDFFYLDEDNNMVFVAPNKGAKTKNTTKLLLDFHQNQMDICILDMLVQLLQTLKVQQLMAAILT